MDHDNHLDWRRRKVDILQTVLDRRIAVETARLETLRQWLSEITHVEEFSLEPLDEVDGDLLGTLEDDLLRRLYILIYNTEHQEDLESEFQDDTSSPALMKVLADLYDYFDAAMCTMFSELADDYASGRIEIMIGAGWEIRARAVSERELNGQLDECP